MKILIFCRRVALLRVYKDSHTETNQCHCRHILKFFYLSSSFLNRGFRLWTLHRPSRILLLWMYRKALVTTDPYIFLNVEYDDYLKSKAKSSSQAEKLLREQFIFGVEEFIIFRLMGGETPDSFLYCVWLVVASHDLFWLVPWIGYTWTGNDLFAIEVHLKAELAKKISVQNNRGRTVFVSSVFIIRFLWITSRQGQSFDWECFAMFRYRTVFSQNSNFGRKREDKSFYKRFVFCFCSSGSKSEILPSTVNFAI